MSNNFHACFYLTRSTMTAELDGYSLAGWEFVAWVDTEWDTSERRAALFRRPERTT